MHWLIIQFVPPDGPKTLHTAIRDYAGGAFFASFSAFFFFISALVSRILFTCQRPSTGRIRNSVLGRHFNSQPLSQLRYVCLQLLLPVYVDHFLCLQPIPDCPREIRVPYSPLLVRLQCQRRKHTQSSHGNQCVCKLECFECYFSFADHWQPGESMVKVVTFPISLHYVCALWVVDIAYL